MDHVFVVAVGNGGVQTRGAVNSLSAGLGYKCMYVAGSITHNIYTTFERGKKVGWPSYCIRGKVVPSYEERCVVRFHASEVIWNITEAFERRLN